MRSELTTLRRWRRCRMDRPRPKRRILAGHASVVRLTVVPEHVFWTENLHRPDVAREVSVARRGAIGPRQFLPNQDPIAAHRVTGRSAIVESAQRVVIDPQLENPGPAPPILDDHEVIGGSGRVHTAKVMIVVSTGSHGPAVRPEKYC